MYDTHSSHTHTIRNVLPPSFSVTYTSREQKSSTRLDDRLNTHSGVSGPLQVHVVYGCVCVWALKPGPSFFPCFVTLNTLPPNEMHEPKSQDPSDDVRGEAVQLSEYPTPRESYFALESARTATPQSGDRYAEPLGAGQ